METTDWMKVTEELDREGFVHISQVLAPKVCEEIIGFYEREQLFRSTINMERYRFGKGEYKYLRYPLPAQVQALRETLFPRLVPLANEWMKSLGMDIQYPADLSAFLATCHAGDQKRPTPLILKYGAGGYNTLHQDIYGDVYFPFQVVFALSQRGRDFEGGELVFVEQLPRAQSRATVVTPDQGDAVIFTTNFRPVQGSRGFYRTRLKHGVSKVTNGERYTMGVIFHDAS